MSFISQVCLCNTPGSAPSHRAGLEPGIPAQEAGALPRRLKATASNVRFTHSPYWHTSVTLTPLNLTPVRVTAPMQHLLPGPHHHNSFLYRVGLEPGIPAQEAGALPRRLKATASSVRFTHSPYWHTSVTLTPLNLTPVRVTAPMQHPLPGPHHHNSFLYRVGLKPGIPAQEAGALPRRLKATASSVRFTHSPYWHTSVTLTPLNLTPVRVTAPMQHPLPGPHHHNSFLFRAGLEPGIPAQEAGALPRTLKATASTIYKPLLAYIHYIYTYEEFVIVTEAPRCNRMTATGQDTDDKRIIYK